MAKLSDLKTLLAGVPRTKRATARDNAERASPTTKRAGQTAKSAADDLDLAHAFADVAPLASGNRAQMAKAATSPSPTKRLADEAAALAASRHGVDASPGAWDVGQEIESEQTFRRTGLGADVVSKLRRGHWAVQAELDLHGHTSEEAHAALVLFLAEARSRGWRCVRVIHGKGLSSPNREPVLKGKVRRWLTYRNEVLAYCEAPRYGGGSGAVLVLLMAPSA
ncbi:MAG TPA: Smr/MutS family protein [Casimicrobiaceae bacterium]